jgi:TetR/AcrR family transcriptional repressor of nem operon
MGSLPESFREQLATVFKDWENRVAACFREACAKGDLALGTDCQRLASYFWIGWEGAVLRAKLEGSPQAIEFFSEFFFAGLPR